MINFYDYTFGFVEYEEPIEFIEFLGTISHRGFIHDGSGQLGWWRDLIFIIDDPKWENLQHWLPKG